MLPTDRTSTVLHWKLKRDEKCLIVQRIPQADSKPLLLKPNQAYERRNQWVAEIRFNMIAKLLFTLKMSSIRHSMTLACFTLSKWLHHMGKCVVDVHCLALLWFPSRCQQLRREQMYWRQSMVCCFCIRQVGFWYSIVVDWTSSPAMEHMRNIVWLFCNWFSHQSCSGCKDKRSKQLTWVLCHQQYG